MAFLTTILFVTIFASPIRAWVDTAQCATGFDWNRNSLGQDPCTVGFILDASCRSLTQYAYPPLAGNNEYCLPPRAANSGELMCRCNTVMYSLYMACALCQGGQTYSWTDWIPECTSVYVSQYPANIPQGTTVPHWAYHDITLLPDQTWDASVAMNVRRHPEELLKRVDPTSGSSPSPFPFPSGPTILKRMRTNTPGPAMPTGTTDAPGPTDTKNSPNPTDTANSPDPTNTTNSPDPTETANSPEPTTPTSSGAGSPRPTNSTSSTSSRPPTNATGGNANPPAPTNACNSKGGTNVWVIVVVYLWVLI